MLNDEWFAGVLESDKREAQRIVQALVERHGADWVETSSRISAAGKVENPFKTGLVRACDIPAPVEIARLWFGFYPRSVVLFVGESGAGKSSLLYNICIHAARNEPLYGVPFGLGRPLRVLYIDPENSGNYAEGDGGQCAVKLEFIGQGVPEGLHFHAGDGVNLANVAHVAALKELIEEYRYDLVILDPIANLFGTRDENDNAEAARQMTAMTSLSRQTGACVVAVHHTGKNTTGDYGRGASARLGAADVAMMFRVKSDTEDVDDTFQGTTRERDDVCRLQIVKNRRQGRGSLYLQMAGQDRFTVSSFEAWKSGGPRNSQRDEVSKCQLAEGKILELLENGEWRSRTELVDAMAVLNFGRPAVDGALEILTSSESIICERGARGAKRYILKTAYSQAEISFQFSPPPIGETGKLKTENEAKGGNSGLVDGFMKATQEGEEGWE